MREHPLLKPGLRGYGRDETLLVRTLNSFRAIFLRNLVVNLAKLSVKEGGRQAAHRLHRYLAAEANGTIPAHEITVIHGLILGHKIELDAGAYLAPYADVRAEFDLPPEPETLFGTSFPDPTVLVRDIEFGPRVVPPGSYEDLPEVEAAYRFPADHRIDYKDWFADSSLLIDLFSIATGVPLISHTLYVRLAEWIQEMDPEFGAGTHALVAYSPDWLLNGHDPTIGEIEAFLKLVRYMHANDESLNKLKRAARRLGSSLSRSWGRFGQEDRILDVAIALEIMYELEAPEITYKLRTRAGYFLGNNSEERVNIFENVKCFYNVRSKIVHDPEKAGDRDLIREVSSTGFDLARQTLLKLVYEGRPADWNLVVMSAGEGAVN